MNELEQIELARQQFEKIFGEYGLDMTRTGMDGGGTEVYIEYQCEAAGFAWMGYLQRALDDFAEKEQLLHLACTA